MKKSIENNQYTAANVILPPHAYHPNATLRNRQRAGYVAYPDPPASKQAATPASPPLE